jgi:predicted membrane protein
MPPPPLTKRKKRHKMKSRILIPVILLMLALAPKNLSAQETNQSTSSLLSLEISSDKFYSGETVKTLLDAVGSVAKDKITTAFNEGYKQGLLDAYPDAIYWQNLAVSMTAAAKKSATLDWGTTALISGVSFIIGVFVGK